MSCRASSASRRSSRATRCSPRWAEFTDLGSVCEAGAEAAAARVHVRWTHPILYSHAAPLLALSTHPTSAPALPPFTNLQHFHVPDVIPELSTEQVLTSEWVPGVHIDKVGWHLGWRLGWAGLVGWGAEGWGPP